MHEHIKSRNVPPVPQRAHVDHEMTESDERRREREREKQ